jgi:hypothetical protein
LRGRGRLKLRRDERRGVVTEMGGDHRVHLGEEEKWGECTYLSSQLEHTFSS